MTEKRLRELARYRRTWMLIHRWEPPDGVRVGLVCFPHQCRIDVTMACVGVTLDDMNVRYDSEEEAKERLDFMAEIVLKEAKAAYERHEIKDDGVVFRMTMAQAERRFVEGLESALCKGKGGDE